MAEARPFDVGNIQDPEVRRALRTLHQQVTESLARQQLEIDAILELMFDKGAGSIGEFKRHLILLQQNRSRGQRIHDVIDSISIAPPSSTSAPARH